MIIQCLQIQKYKYLLNLEKIVHFISLLLEMPIKVLKAPKYY